MAVSLKKNFVYSSILTTSNFIFPLLIYPYITRVLGVSNIGLCDFVDSIINYFTLFSMMGIAIVGTREIAKAKEDPTELRRIFSSLFFLNMATTIVAELLLFVAYLMVSTLRDYPVMVSLGAAKVLFNFLLINWFFQGMEDFRYVTVRTIIVKSFYVASIFVFVKNPDDYVIYYLLTTLMIVVNAVINLAYSRRIVRISLKDVDFKLFLKPYFILGFYTFLCSMYTTFNIAYLGFVTNTTEVGYYSTATRFFNIILAFFTAFTTVALPRLSVYIGNESFDEYKNLLKKSIEILVSFSVPIIILCEVCAPGIISILAGPGFEGGILPMRIVLPLIFIVGYEQVLIIQGLMPLKKDGPILINSCVGTVVGLTLNILLISRFAAIGAAIVWLCSEISVLISAQFFMTKFVGIKFPVTTVIRYSFYYFPLALILLLLYNMFDNYWTSVIVSGLSAFSYFILLNGVFLKNSFVTSVLTSFRKRNK